jgi:hypothetical protein
MFRIDHQLPVARVRELRQALSLSMWWAGSQALTKNTMSDR